MRGWEDGTMEESRMGGWEDGQRGGEEGDYVVLAFPPPPTTPPVVPIDLPYPGQGARRQGRAPPPPRCRLRSRPAQSTNRPAGHARGASTWPRLRRSPAARHHSPLPTQPPSPSSPSWQLAPSGPFLLAQIPHGDAERGGQRAWPQGASLGLGTRDAWQHSPASPPPAGKDPRWIGGSSTQGTHRRRGG